MMHPRAGQKALEEDLVDVDALLDAYYDNHPDPADPDQAVAFGTSGHRGSSLDTAFTEDHIAATTQAIVEYRAAQGIRGPLFIGRDTHALSRPAFDTALEVLAANDVATQVDSRDGFTPTPAISHAILVHNRGRSANDPGRADGIVVTPSHNPPRDGGFKYNPPHGGPADTDATSWIADRANELLATGLRGVRRHGRQKALQDADRYDFLHTYVEDLPNVIDIEAIRRAGVRIGADPLGGAAVDYWAEIGEMHDLDLTVVNPEVDPRWSFMTLDRDGKIRMDCSSPWAMASLLEKRDEYDIATGNDPDSDRHGIVTPDGGLMDPNHYLATAIRYLFAHRPHWPSTAKVGKTLVSSSLIDRVVASLGRELYEVPVGFKWFVPGLIDSSVGFGGEESAACLVPAPRRVRVDHGQGRDHPGAAGLGDPRRHRPLPQHAACRTGRGVRHQRLRPHGCARESRAEGDAESAQRRSGRCDGAGRGADRLGDHRGPRRWRDRRPEGVHGIGVVRGPPLRHRGHLQDLRRVVQG